MLLLFCLKFKKNQKNTVKSSREVVRVNSNLCERTWLFIFPKQDELVEYICGRAHKNDSS